MGLAKNLKKRYSKHKRTLKDRGADGQTTLWKFVWEQRDKQTNLVITWIYPMKNIPDFIPVTGLCKLCTREKF